ncbi:pentatricopeptide repeat-containing protein At3g49240, mitochondrial [Andrographis paniculata]|uniref:pentatricopeptide repeat-containing protein At3g49240, mitochondrial n=1 Tax=Andrographis paniculata TaxID=175694 RepID=UPI0021E73904|nr:pentatricopeptide repeat-containing protein At3g49240, mitochondrial [Andrographis paniculata]
MALSKPSLFNHLAKTLAKSGRLSPHAPPPRTFLPVRFFSFATPEEAAAERRKRKRRLRIEPPLSSLRQQQQPRPTPTPAPQNPNAPKLPEPVSALSGNRLNLHNRILKLIRENDLEEAALLTRHSIYSNCRPTIYTCNAVMAAQLRQGKYAELLSLHRFITQAGVAANVVTHNLLLNVYLDCRKTDLALEQYKQLINDAPFNPSLSTYRILIKGLVDNQLVEKAIEIKDEMAGKGFKPDPTVYAYLMLGQAKNSNAEGVFELYEELEQKMETDKILDGVVYGNLMKGYFLKGMETEAMECYRRVVGEDSTVTMNAVAYNYILEALCKNGKLDEALNLFEKMKTVHDPPRKLTVNLGSYNIIVDGYCAENRYSEAIEVFNSMGEKRCSPDTLSYNVLIDQLCRNEMFVEAENLYKGMADKNVSPDEYTFTVLMDTCLQENRTDDAAHYFKTMVESKLRPNMAVYNRLIEGLIDVGKVDEAKFFFEMMLPKLRMNDDAYKCIMKALFEAGKHDEVLKIVDGMLREDPNDFTEELEEFVREWLRKEGREDEFTNIRSTIEKEKAEAAAKAAEEAERAKANAKAAVASLLPSKLLNNENKKSEEAEESTEDTAATSASLDEETLPGKDGAAEIEGSVVSKQGAA